MVPRAKKPEFRRLGPQILAYWPVLCVVALCARVQLPALPPTLWPGMLFITSREFFFCCSHWLAVMQTSFRDVREPVSFTFLQTTGSLSAAAGVA